MLTYCCHCQDGFLVIYALESFSHCLSYSKEYEFSVEKAQYHFQRIHISNSNCNTLITCIASSPGTDMALKCLPSWGSAVLPCYGDQRRVKKGKDLLKATLKYRLGGRRRSNNGNWNASCILENPCYSILV